MNIQLSQIFLVIALLVFGLYVFRVRTVFTDRIVLLILAIGGLVMVIHPNLSMWVANRIGIGRGTDLLLYVFILFSMFNFVGISSELKKIERQLTEVVRQQALQNPQISVKEEPNQDQKEPVMK
jgi:hypothetical protein